MFEGKMGGLARVVLTAVLAGSAGIGCVNSEPEGDDVGAASDALRAERVAMPTDNTPQTSVVEKPAQLIKTPKFTKTPPDRVEILEGTYRTVGSRRYLLEAIKQSNDDYRATLVQIYRDVLPKLSIADAQAAEAELVGVMAALSANGGQK